jgi:hypothetical protein
LLPLAPCPHPVIIGYKVKVKVNPKAKVRVRIRVRVRVGVRVKVRVRVRGVLTYPTEQPRSASMLLGKLSLAEH